MRIRVSIVAGGSPSSPLRNGHSVLGVCYRGADIHMPGDNVPHWLSLHSQRSSFRSFPCCRRWSTRPNDSPASSPRMTDCEQYIALAALYPDTHARRCVAFDGLKSKVHPITQHAQLIQRQQSGPAHQSWTNGPWVASRQMRRSPAFATQAFAKVRSCTKLYSGP